MIDALMCGFRVVLRPGALLPWFTLVAAVCAGVVLMDLNSTFYASAVFVLLGPLLPIAGLGLSYVRSVDADYQLVLASPYSTLRLLLSRAATFLALATPVLLLCGHRLQTVQLGARVLAHAAAVDAIALAQSTLLAPTLSAVVASLAWVSLVQVFLVTNRLVAITSSHGVAAAVCTSLAALLILIVRRRALSTDWRYS
jgi:hypothetical protein